MTSIELNCPGCNADLPDGAATCPECGADLSALLRLKMEPYLLYNQGLSLAQSGDREAAIFKLRAAVAAMPGEPEAYILLGKIYAQMGEFAQARHWWEAALRRWPEQAAARQGLEALEAAQAKAKAEASREQERHKRQRWVGAAAIFAAGGLLVTLLMLAWGGWRSPALAPAASPTTLVVAAALTPTATPAPATAVAPSTTPTATPVATATAMPSPSQTPPPSSTAQPSPTPDLASLVVSAIQAHPRLAGAEISVAQQGSAILLQGEVPSIGLKYLLEALAKAVPGVALVDVSGVRVVYRVMSGDTLSGIALRMYGQASLWLPIMQANDLANPNRIYPEQRLVIPPPD